MPNLSVWLRQFQVNCLTWHYQLAKQNMFLKNQWQYTQGYKQKLTKRKSGFEHIVASQGEGTAWWGVCQADKLTRMLDCMNSQRMWSSQWLATKCLSAHSFFPKLLVQVWFFFPSRRPPSSPHGLRTSRASMVVSAVKWLSTIWSGYSHCHQKPIYNTHIVNKTIHWLVDTL